ncbi:MAG: cyclopropane-fatty-acyl-phospholipid synthase, partial [Acidimicrobiaceae bacterium]
MQLESILQRVLGDELPVHVRAYDGSAVGPPDAPATVVLRSPAALQRILTSPGELGFARAYVAGDLDVEGDIFAALELRDRLPEVRLTPGQLAQVARALGWRGIRPVSVPPEEARLRGRRHSRSRDAAAIAHHYDVGNDFYRIILGPSLTYSCAVFEHDSATLEAAQEAKYELICRKLGLADGMRLLDVGCGWGSMLLHAADRYGVDAVGVTLAHEQAGMAKKRIAEHGVANQVEVRLQDERDVNDGPYDAISSIGMFEHVGEGRLAEYFEHLFALLRPGGRLLNHGISRPPGEKPRLQRAGFVDRYVFPDGELHE